MPKPSSLGRYMESMGKPKDGNCYACGGMVDSYGKAFGGEVQPTGEHRHIDEIANAVDEADEPLEGELVLPEESGDEEDEDKTKANFVTAIRNRRK